MVSRRILTNDIKSLAINLGADLVGIAPVERFKEAPEKLRPEAHVTGARAVIVITMHIPDATIDMWAHPPGEPVLPYHTFGHVWLSTRLNLMEFDIIRLVERAGYYALPIMSTQGYGRRVHAEISHRHAAVCAGLGEFGQNGLVLTPEYGPRQRFASIITDAPLEPSQMYDGPRICDDCYRCIDACPMNAISKKEKSIVIIEGRSYEYGKVDPWRCWWCELYGLLSKSGPQYLGFTTDIKPPKEVTPDNLMEAGAKRDPWLIHSHSYPWCGLCLRECTAGKKSRDRRLQARREPD